MRLRLTPLALVTTVLVLFAAPALAQRAPRSPSAEAFSFCREQEKLGDARACWSVWTQKYRATGTEAETAYAEARASASPIANARLQLTSTPSATVTLDGRPLGVTPKDSVEVAPGEHRVAFTSRGLTEGRTFTVTAGETRAVDVKFESPGPRPPPGPRNQPAPRTALPTGDVLDFCALDPRNGSAKVRKERVVLFAPSGAEQVNDDAEIHAVEGARLVREVFTARFAMDQFHNVVGSFAGRRGWERRESLSLAEMRDLLKGDPDERDPVAGDPVSGERFVREKRLISYSLGCADYVVVPVITSHETKWESLPVAAPGRESTDKAMALAMDAELAIFRRQPGGAVWFKRIARLTASVPVFGAQAGSDGVTSTTRAPDSLQLPRYVSGVPDATCTAYEAATDGVPGLGACATRGEGTAEQALGNRDERLGTACTRARDGSTPSAERTPLAVECEVRTRTFQLARALAEDARQVDGWKLFAMLAHAETPASIPVGRAEGLRVGDAFEVRDGRNERVAFLKAVEIGPGGAAGEREHTVLSTRAGDAPEGARIDAYRQLGIVFAPYGSFGMLTFGSGTTTVHSGATSQDFSLPDAVFGGGASIGFDLSSVLRSTETYVRVGGGVLTGSGLNTTAMLVPIDLWLEKGLYVARRVTLTAAVGGTVQLTSVTLATALGPSADDLHLSSIVAGPAARLGFDVLLHPDWSVRIEGVARVPLNGAAYTEGDGKPIPDEWRGRDDHFATLTASLGIARTF
jgi:hypothetical protein